MTIDNVNDYSADLLDDNRSLIEIMSNNDNEIDLENNEPTLFQDSPYYEHEDFMNLLDGKSDTFILLSLNCQSLYSKFQELKCLIDLYNTKNRKISALLAGNVALSGL